MREDGLMPEPTVDLSYTPSPHSVWNRLLRLAWGIFWLLIFRPSPRPFFAFRRFCLRLFGARIGKGANIYPSCRIWGPWNLTMGEHSCLADRVDCYCVAPIRLGAHAGVSQYSYLCSASHDYEDPRMPLTTAPIEIGDQAWVCADVFVGPGVTIGPGAVVGARSSVYKDVAPWTVVGGNPAKFIKKRVLRT
jgi:putative colanic acid biosynthesis acetyltransferase WcaF